MKKIFSIITLVMMVAFLATSCGPKTPEPILLGDGNLTAYATLQDDVSKTFFWGVYETKSGIAKIKCVFTAPPKIFDEFFIGDTPNKKIVFDNSGKILISGTHCFIDNLIGGEKFIVSRSPEGEKVYILANGKTVGPKEKLFISTNRIYYRQDDKLGVLSYNNKEILQNLEEIYIVNGKAKEGEKKPIYHLCKDDSGYKLYDEAGKLVRKMNKVQASKYTKDVLKYMDGLYSSRVAY